MYNQSAEKTISKDDFVSYVSTSEINYCTVTDGLLLTVAADRDSMKIRSINLSCDNSSSENLEKTAEYIINCISPGDTEKAGQIVSSLSVGSYCSSDSFYKSYVFEKDLTYAFISNDAGNLFYINYNELNPVLPTEIPEFQENYTLAENRE